MKKLLSILLALTMVLSLGTVAFAAEDETTAEPNSKLFQTVVDDEATTEKVENATSFDVTAKANVIPEGKYANIEYAVTVEWTVDVAEIEINGGTVYKWNPTTFKYEEDTSEGGDKLGKDTVGVQITLTNRSNAAVTYEIVYADNTADKLTTEAGAVADKDGKAQVTGDLGSADIIEGLSKTSVSNAFDYDIDIDKQGDNDKGEEQTKTYKDTVKVTAIATDANLGDAADVTLGTYTVTLGKYVAPEEPEVTPEEPVVKTYTSITEILKSVNNFPWKEGDEELTNAWVDENGSPFTLYVLISEAHPELSGLRPAGGVFPLDATVKKGNDGNYTATHVEYEGTPEAETATMTFVMNGNVLTSIIYHYTMDVIDHQYTFIPPTT